MGRIINADLIPPPGRALETMGQAALRLAALGWSVFAVFEPTGDGHCACGASACASPGKHPRVADWPNKATTDAATVRAWWQRWPLASIGIATGAASGLVVLDVDPRRGGDEALAALTGRYGPLPATVEAVTGGGGRHLLFAHPGGVVRNSVDLAGFSGLDVRGDGGFIVGPPSRHVSGGEYRWRAGLEAASLAALPPWLLALAHTASRRNGTAPSVAADRIVAGARNATLTSLAGGMRRQGMTPEEILVALAAVNERCDPPLSEDEVSKIAGSVGRYAPAPSANDAGATGRRARLVCLGDVEPKPVEWLWPGHIPRGKLTLLIGDPGVGKSFLVADLLARLSAGAEWPDGSPAPVGTAILLSAEDAPDDTLRPRIDAQGGDPSRIVVLQAVVQGACERLFNLAEDLPVLGRAIAETGASLVAIDPLNAYLGKADSHRDSEMRGLIFAPLADLAQRLGVAVVGVMHVSKDTDKRAVHRALGSVAFSAAPRAVFAVGKHPEDDGRRLLAPVKLNNAAFPPVLGFAVVEGRLEWEGAAVSGLDADAVLGSFGSPDDRAERRDAVAFLRELFEAEGGSVSAKHVHHTASQAGIPRTTLYRVKARLGIASRHVGQPGEAGEWLWVWPSDGGASEDAQPPPKVPTPGGTEHLRLPQRESSRNDADSAEDVHIPGGEHVRGQGEHLRAAGLGEGSGEPEDADGGPLYRAYARTRAKRQAAAPPAPAAEVWTCRICGQAMARPDFAAHVSGHDPEARR